MKQNKWHQMNFYEVFYMIKQKESDRSFQSQVKGTSASVAAGQVGVTVPTLHWTVQETTRPRPLPVHEPWLLLEGNSLDWEFK